MRAGTGKNAVSLVAIILTGRSKRRSGNSMLQPVHDTEQRYESDGNKDGLQGGIFFIGRVRCEVLKYFVVVMRCGFIRRQFG